MLHFHHTTAVTEKHISILVNNYENHVSSCNVNFDENMLMTIFRETFAIFIESSMRFKKKLGIEQS